MVWLLGRVPHLFIRVVRAIFSHGPKEREKLRLLSIKIMKTLLYAMSLAALLTTVGCATRYDGRGGTSAMPEYQMGTDQVPNVPTPPYTRIPSDTDAQPDAWDDQQFPHSQHF